ncbi:hypothetical protein PLESTM_001772800 [Pleodorina starrii]|nr:hypothetical protein PLESTM_001772800 [Pleodorina starrii]
MAIPGRLATGCGLARTQQPLPGVPFGGRERSNVSGVPHCVVNALPTSTSLPRLGPESSLRLGASGEVIVDTALLAAPVRRAVFRQVERPAELDEEREREPKAGADGPSRATAAAAAAAPLSPQADAAVGPAHGEWSSSHSGVDLDLPDDLGGSTSGVDQQRNSLELQPPPRPAGRSGAARIASVPTTRSTDTPHTSTAGALEPTPAAFEWTLRSPEQQHLPPSPPSASVAPPAGDSHPGRANRGGRSHGPAASDFRRPPSDPRRHDALLSRVLAATNWYELRAVLISGGGGGGGAAAVALASSPDAVLAVLRRLAAVAAYDMRPPEAAQLGAFLERWLLQHTDALRLMGPAELSLCLHSLAKLARAVPAPPPAWTAAWFAAAQPYLLQYGFRPKDLSLSLWALSRLQLRLPPAAVQLLLAAAEPHLPRFNGQDMSLVALALSALQARSAGGGGGAAASAAAAAESPSSLLPSAAWQAAFLQRCGAVLPECGSQALANLLHGVVRGGMAAPDWLLYDMCAALYGKLPECNPQALANVLSALAAAGHRPEDGWVERFLVESAARMTSGGSGGDGFRAGHGGGGGVCNLDDLTHLASAAAQLALTPPRWWAARLYGAMEQQLPRASPRQLAQLLHAVAQLYRAAPPPPPPAHPAAEPPPTLLPPPRSLLAAWQRAAIDALPGFNAIDAAHSLWALAALGERPPTAWLQRLLVTCRGGLAAAPPGDLAVLAWSLAALRFRPTWSWLADAVEASQPALGRMSGQDLAMLTTALVRLGCRPQRSWSGELLGAVEGRMAGLEDRALSQTAWAMYRLRVQPPPEWLGALTAELQRRWGERAAAGGDGGGGGGEELRHAVVLLWLMAMWLGGQRARGRGGGPGRGRRHAARRGGGGGGGSGRQPTRRRFRVKRSGGGAATSAESGSPLEREATTGVGPAAAATAAAAASTDAAAAAPPRRCCRVTSRMLRRRRATKPGNLVAALGGDVRAAAAFRRRLADQLLGPAMDATAPALAAGVATPQDVALLAAVVWRLPRAAGRAAAARPAWRRALLAATAPHLSDLPAAGLVQVLAGVESLDLVLEPEWATAAARAAGTHLAAPHLPAAVKVSLLRRLCRLRVASAGSTLPVPPPPQAAVTGRRRVRGGAVGARWSWGPVLEVGLRTLRQASSAVQPLLQLQVELLKARVRLRKLGPLVGPAGGAAAAAALRQLAAAQAAGAAAASGGYDATALAAAAANVRAAVAAAAVAASAAMPEDDEDEEAELRRRGRARQRRRRVPPIGEGQRAWIWARARRTVAARMADASPVLVVTLVELISEQNLVVRVARGGGAGTASVGAAAAAQPPPAPDARCGAASLLWLAAATRRWWRAMLPTHRARVARAWRRVLGSLTPPRRRRPIGETSTVAAAAGGGDRISGSGNAASGSSSSSNSTCGSGGENVSSSSSSSGGSNSSGSGGSSGGSYSGVEVTGGETALNEPRSGGSGAGPVVGSVERGGAPVAATSRRVLGTRLAALGRDGGGGRVL